MKTRSLIVLFIISLSSFAFTLDVIDDIASSIRSGNPKNISKNFYLKHFKDKFIWNQKSYKTDAYKKIPQIP